MTETRTDSGDSLSAQQLLETILRDLERPLVIGFAYDVPVGKYTSEGLESVSAEYEDAPTIAWLRAILQELGDVVDLPWGADIVARLGAAELDVVFNITEAVGGRNRESLIPALAEARGIPYTGTDALGLGISLDKHMTKVLARHADVPTPGSVLLSSPDQWEERLPDLSALHFPVIVKPNHGGSSLGIRRFSRTESLSELHESAKWVLDNFADGALVEEFVSGREFTVGLLAMPRSRTRSTFELRVLPVAELYIEGGGPDAFFSFEEKTVPNKDEVICPASPPEGTAALMVDYAIRIFEALGCRDMARIDFRLGHDGVPYFLEINPLPGLSPCYSSFPAQAEAAGISPKELVHLLVVNALIRGD
ncbi:MAG: D-alanine--D-alanine ligase family protein [Anaerolineae bacterium]